LTKRLVARGDDVTVLTRGAPSSGERLTFIHWDGKHHGAWTDAVDGADAIVHLSGKRVDCRPTTANVNELITSRVQPVLAVGRAVDAASVRPKVWVQISTLAIFGEGGEEIIDESTQPSGVGPPQMVQVGLAWESAARTATSKMARFVLLRGGIGLGGSGDPATKRLIALARWGLGGKIGSGRQWVSWVSADDFIDVILRAIDQQTMSGLYHVTSPNPVRNAEMMKTYRELVRRRWGLPSSSLITKVGACIIGSDSALALTGRRAVPTRLVAEGYRFRYPHFAQAADLAVTATRNEKSEPGTLT
jgi:uncharacterized protein (TIGR01777 family)